MVLRFVVSSCRASCHVLLSEGPMWIEGDVREEDVPPPDKGIKGVLAVDDDAEDDWDHWQIQSFSAIDVQYSLLSEFSIIQE